MIVVVVALQFSEVHLITCYVSVDWKEMLKEEMEKKTVETMSILSD